MVAAAAPQKPTGPFIWVKYTEEGVRSLVATTGLESRITLVTTGLLKGTCMQSNPRLLWMPACRGEELGSSCYAFCAAAQIGSLQRKGAKPRRQRHRFVFGDD